MTHQETERYVASYIEEIVRPPTYYSRLTKCCKKILYYGSCWGCGGKCMDEYDIYDYYGCYNSNPKESFNIGYIQGNGSLHRGRDIHIQHIHRYRNQEFIVNDVPGFGRSNSHEAGIYVVDNVPHPLLPSIATSKSDGAICTPPAICTME